MILFQKLWEIYLTRGHSFDSEGHLFEMEGQTGKD